MLSRLPDRINSVRNEEAISSVSKRREITQNGESQITYVVLFALDSTVKTNRTPKMRRWRMSFIWRRRSFDLMDNGENALHFIVNKTILMQRFWRNSSHAARFRLWFVMLCKFILILKILYWFVNPSKSSRVCIWEHYTVRVNANVSEMVNDFFRVLLSNWISKALDFDAFIIFRFMAKLKVSWTGKCMFDLLIFFFPKSPLAFSMSE